MLCVLHMAAVERCIFAEDGVAAAGRGPSLVIDFSTADPDGTRQAAAKLKSLTGAGWIDAPVSGGPQLARIGGMTVMAGGSAADFAQAKPIIEQMAGNLTLMGPVGAGQTTKIINQAIVGTGDVVMAEALMLAEAAGIAPRGCRNAWPAGMPTAACCSAFIRRCNSVPSSRHRAMRGNCSRT